MRHDEGEITKLTATAKLQLLEVLFSFTLVLRTAKKTQVFAPRDLIRCIVNSLWD